jgi:2-keto-4-pentenoate hydratase
LSDRFPNLDVDSAYEYRWLNVERALAAGKKIQWEKDRPHFQSNAEHLNVETPDFGHLFPIWK